MTNQLAGENMDKCTLKGKSKRPGSAVAMVTVYKTQEVCPGPALSCLGAWAKVELGAQHIPISGQNTFKVMRYAYKSSKNVISDKGNKSFYKIQTQPRHITT